MCTMEKEKESLKRSATTDNYEDNSTSPVKLTGFAATAQAAQANIIVGLMKKNAAIHGWSGRMKKLIEGNGKFAMSRTSRRMQSEHP